MQHKNETLVLGWLDPRNNSIMHAGVGFYNATYGEYLLKIDEEPCEKQYYLKPCACEGERTSYRMELVIKRKNSKFLKRQRVGTGYSRNDCVFINYGSKFKNTCALSERRTAMTKKLWKIYLWVCSGAVLNLPDLALAWGSSSFESRIRSFTDSLMSVVLPAVAILGLLYAAMLAMGGDEGAKRRMVLVVIASVVGFLAPPIIRWFQSAAVG